MKGTTRRALVYLAVGPRQQTVAYLVLGWCLLLSILNIKMSFLLSFAFVLPPIFFAGLIAFVVRRKRLRDWSASEGTIRSCSPLEGNRGYRCTYVFWPDDARQGGTFLISGSNARLDEIRSKLIGCTVHVRYDPKDYTRCMVEDTQVMNWVVAND